MRPHANPHQESASPATEETGRKLTQTMRIDMIPDSPRKPVTNKRKRYVITSSPQRSADKRIESTASSSAPTEYQTLLQSLYDAALITDLSGKIISANMRAEEFLLYDQGELHKLGVFDIVTGSDASLIQTLRDNLKEERFILIQAYCLRKDGTLFPAEIAVNLMNLRKPHLGFFIRDITRRSQANEMLRTEHNAIQNAADGIAICNIHYHLEYVNPAVLRLWGYVDGEKLLGMDVRDLFADAARVVRILDEVMGERQYWNGEIKARHADGSDLDIQASMACNRNSDGDVVGVIFSFTNIGDRKRAEEAERKSERRRIMLESFGTACHHLGQPATVLQANLGMLKQRLDRSDDPLVHEIIDSSLEAMDSLGQILHKLNRADEYRTTAYLDNSAPDESDSQRIIEI